jgi:hypothetical protein
MSVYETLAAPDRIVMAGEDFTLSLGGNLDYDTMAMRRTADHLVLTLGGGDTVTIRDWFAAGTVRPNITLQVVAEAMAEFAAGGSDPLRDQKIETFDLDAIAGAFEAEKLANPTLVSWSITNALTDFHLGGSDDAAIGGDLAVNYGLTGTLAGTSLNGARAMLGDPSFGSAQSLGSLAPAQPEERVLA